MPRSPAQIPGFLWNNAANCTTLNKKPGIFAAKLHSAQSIEFCVESPNCRSLQVISRLWVYKKYYLCHPPC